MSSADAILASDQIGLDTPSADDARREAERVLSSADFPASTKRRAFLRFIIDETFAGRGDRLKGYSVASAVFGRDETFDAQTDPVVRLEARRLRRDLDSYYVGAGSQNPVRISIPKGSYVPRFEWHAAALPHSQPRQQDESQLPAEKAPNSTTLNTYAKTGSSGWHKFLPGAAGLLALVMIAAASWFLSAVHQRASTTITGASENGPAVVVLPFTAVGSTENSQYLARGIADELIGDLMLFPNFRVYTSPLNLSGNSTEEPAKTGHDLGAAYVVTGTIRDDAETVRVTARVLEAATGRVLWTKSYTRQATPMALIRAERELADEIATALGQPYGIVNSDLVRQLNTPAVSSMKSYVCVLRAYGYRRGFDRTQFDDVLACLQETVRRDPKYSDAWAMLAWLHTDAGRLGYFGAAKRQAEYKIAVDAASKAVELAPNRSLALRSLATIYYYTGRYDESEKLARRALQLNPYDPDAMAQLGWRLAARGRFDEGIPLLKQAIKRALNPPGWYFTIIAIDQCLKGDYGQMLDVAQHTSANGTGFGQILIAVAAGKLGKRELAQTALAKLSKFKMLAADPAGFMRVHGATEQIVTAVVSGLANAHQMAGEPKTNR